MQFVWDDEKVLKMDSYDGCTILWMHSTSLNHKWLKWHVLLFASFKQMPIIPLFQEGNEVEVSQVADPTIKWLKILLLVTISSHRKGVVRVYGSRPFNTFCLFTRFQVLNQPHCLSGSANLCSSWDNLGFIYSKNKGILSIFLPQPGKTPYISLVNILTFIFLFVCFHH